MSIQRKSPDRTRTRAKAEKQTDQAHSFYPALALLIKVCAACGFCRHQSARRFLCTFRGKTVSDVGRCEFWTAQQTEQV